MNQKLSQVFINDLFDELKEENNRLLNQLLFAQKCIKLFENYRNFLNSFCNNCKCDQNIRNKLTFNDLENQYKSVFNNQINLKFEEVVIEKNNNKIINNTTNRNSKRKPNNNKTNLNKNYYDLIDEQIVIKTQQNDPKDGIIEGKFTNNSND